MDTVATLGCVLGTAWVSGLRLYATVAVLGLCHRFQLATLPGDLAVLANGWIIGTASVLYVIEFAADKIPWIDSAWDAVHSFIRTPAAAALAFAGTTHLDPRVQVVAVLLAGGLALSTHGLKASTRAGANLSPEPLSNWLLSALEEVLALGGAVASALAPVLMLVVVGAFLVALIWLSPRIWRGLLRVFSRRRQGRHAP